MKKIQRNTLKRLAGKDEFEDVETAAFIEKSSLEAIQECLSENPDLVPAASKTQTLVIEGLKPDIESMCRPTASELQELEKSKTAVEDDDLNLEGLDDEEINNYILTHEEADRKNSMWKALNAEYLKEMKEKEERLAKEREEGKPEKKKRKPRKKIIGPSTTAGEAIEKMLQEKKISTKINYDILRTLTEGGPSTSTTTDVDVKSEIAAEKPANADNALALKLETKDLSVAQETGSAKTKNRYPST